MELPLKATLLVHWHTGSPEAIPVQYNPHEITFDKGVQIAEVPIPGLDSPLQQFVRGNAERLTFDLFFDTTDQGMGATVTSVTTKTDKIYQLVKIEPTRHAPPVCTFIWNEHFPGSSIGAGASSIAAGAAGALGTSAAGLATSLGLSLAGPASISGSPTGAMAAAAAAALGNQRRSGFSCIVESVRQKFTFFSPLGVPLRATLTVALREYKTLDQQLARLNLTSPDRTHSHVVQRGETLASIANRYFERPSAWRVIADANDIEDPRRLEPGLSLAIPPTR